VTGGLRRPRWPPETLLSPEVRPDRTVTFRLRAPKASEVSVTGEWMLDYPSNKTSLTKDSEGVWSVTVGPLVPNIYLYSFTVDGMSIADPINPAIKLRARTSARPRTSRRGTKPCSTIRRPPMNA